MAKKNGNGEGSITRHKKSGLYMACYTVQTATGPKRKTVYGKEREEVAELLPVSLWCADSSHASSRRSPSAACVLRVPLWA
jgi:hypothetical protein